MRVGCRLASGGSIFTTRPRLDRPGVISCQPGSPQEAQKPTDTCDQRSGSTVGDVARSATAGQVEAMKPALVAVLGHEQYQNGYYSDFESSDDKYWGAFKFLERASPSNHEFYDNHGQMGVRGLGLLASADDQLNRRPDDVRQRRGPTQRP
jgi:hypothetical protein